MDELATLFGELKPDPWRQEVGYSEDLTAVADSLSASGETEEAVIKILNAWLAKSQPCLFGRLAAVTGRLRYCILTEDDVSRGDQWTRDKIQDSRRDWSAATFNGESSGFLVVLLSAKLADAQPNSVVAEIARRLCSLYLLEDISFDQIHLDQAFLEAPGFPGRKWAWWTGVNYFASHADKRWWHDHRIPGGVAFSVNSVGHMVKSGKLLDGLNKLNKSLGVFEKERSPQKLVALVQALELAMRTILGAADTVSGKATWLLKAPPAPAGSRRPSPHCPEGLTDRVADYDCREYAGYYHTDVTLPSAYFDPAVNRPEGIEVQRLDLTYLFDDSVGNPDFLTMGAGRPIRAGTSMAGSSGQLPSNRRHRIEPRLVDVDSAIGSR